MDWKAQLQGRNIALESDGGERMQIALDEGGRYRLILPDLAALRSVVESLEALPGVGVLPGNGGMLGAKTVGENFSLALHFGRGPSGEGIAADDEEVRFGLSLVGFSAERIAQIGREQPMNISRPERWRLGLARCLLVAPDLLVLDRAFAGLSRREAGALVDSSMAYHSVHPFRPVLFVDLDSHELPAIGDCRAALHVAEAMEETCPS